MSSVQKRQLIFATLRLIFTSALVFCGLLLIFFIQFLVNGTEMPHSAGALSLFYFAIMLVLSIHKKLDVFSLRFLKGLFYHQNREFLHDLSDMNTKVLSILDLNELANVVVNTLSESFSIKNVTLLVLSEDESSFNPASSSGMTISDLPNLALPSDDIIAQTARKLQTVLYRNLINRALSWQEATAASHSFAKLRAHHFFPVFHDQKLLGLLCINSKVNGERLARFEIKHLRGFVAHLSVPIYNARKYTQLTKQIEDLKSTQSHVLQNAKLFAMEKLASGIAHEIHNPLTIISGKAQVMLLKGAKRFDHERVQEVLETIVEQTRRAADITRRLLMFTKPKDGKSNRLINVENVINDTISLVSYQTSLDEIKIIKVIESDIPMFEGNLFEVRELFLNLVLNAIQAIRKNGTITFSSQFISCENLIKISIADTGHGIAAENVACIFDPFYSTAQDRVGLGLFVCQQIVQRLGGAIKVESRINEGSVFIISIPIAQKYVQKADDKFIFCDDGDESVPEDDLLEYEEDDDVMIEEKVVSLLKKNNVEEM